MLAAFDGDSVTDHDEWGLPAAAVWAAESSTPCRYEIGLLPQ